MQRFVILADLHLGLCGIQPDGKSYGDITAVIQQGIARAGELHPQQLVLLGDLVNRGHDDEYAQLKQMLSGPSIIPILGNHELQRASVADFERNMGVRASRVERICGIPSIILNSGIENLPDSEWQGELSAPQLRFLDQELPRIERGPLFVLVHHPIPGTVRDSEKPMFGLTNGHELQSRLERRGGPIVVFSAHTHVQSFARRGSFAYIGCPPLGFWPHAFVTVDREEDELRFATTRMLADPDASPDAGAADPVYRAAREGTPSDQSGVVPLAAR